MMRIQIRDQGSGIFLTLNSKLPKDPNLYEDSYPKHLQILNGFVILLTSTVTFFIA
jgi:hypothetical protein